jgi:hypothetical protein
MQSGATGSRCLPLVVDIRGMDSGRSGARLAWSAGISFGRVPWDGPSGIPQGGIYARVGDVLAVVEALGVDAEQDFDAVPGALGDSGRGNSGGQPERYGRVAQVVGTTSQRRGDLSRRQGQGPGFGPDIADGGGGDGVAAVAAEVPAVRCDAEGVDVRAEDGD